MESDYRQLPSQIKGGKVKEPGSKVFDPATYCRAIKEKLEPSELKISKFHTDPDGLGNLEYLAANDGDDLARDAVPSFLITPEERAYKYLNDFLIPILFPPSKTNTPIVFLKHTMQSQLGTHCIFGLQYQGFEIDEHSFSVHVDKNDHVVMVCGTYLPNLPEMFDELFDSDPDKTEFEDVPMDKIESEIKLIGEYDRANGEKLWLIIWNEKTSKYVVAAGNQIKLSLLARRSQKPKPSIVLRVPAKHDLQTQQIYNSPGFADEKLGLGEIVRDFLKKKTSSLNILDDEHINRKEAILQNLDSTAELKGKYAAIRDEINYYTRDKKGIFLNESESAFDRVTAYYHLDYIQRYFRDKLGFHLLDNYPHLNPVQMVLSSNSDFVAQYDVNSEKIIFYQLASNGFTAVRDPRLVYHEFVHVVTDAIARLHRAGRLLTPRSKEILQAQAMDEGIADYFASSLAERQGAIKAQAYYLKSEGKWGIVRDLDPGNETDELEPIKIGELTNGTKWNKKKYELGELWGRSLWQLRKSLGAEIADILIAHSIFFLTRWATFEQGSHALLLADRLLFSASHRETIEKHREVINKIKFI